jgi:hypothetical protein
VTDFNFAIKKAPLEGEVLESPLDEAGYTRRPLCPFCSAPWSDDMVSVMDLSSSGGGCETCGYGEEVRATVDITCDECERLIYRKEVRDYPNG